MIKTTKKYINDVNILTIGVFDIYNSIDDRIYLKKIFNQLFSSGDYVYFFFRREEDLTNDEELTFLRETTLKKISKIGEFKYLDRIDQQRFDAIAWLKLDIDFANLFIEMFKYFYACDFFKPINGLTFDEYEDYLQVKGVDDVNGVKIIQNCLTNLIVIKGLGADHMVVSYNSLVDFALRD